MTPGAASTARPSDVQVQVEDAKKGTTDQNGSQKKRSHWKYIRKLIPYLWPKGEAALRVRVLVALCALLLSKLATVFSPFALRSAVDDLSKIEGGFVVTLPTTALVLYGLGRLFAKLFQELRDTLFVHVNQHAMKSLAVTTFDHLHRLSHAYHLRRRTGGVLRGIDRGTKGVQWLVTFLIFQIVPTLLELAMVTVIMLAEYDVYFALILVGTVSLYIFFTIYITEWRVKFRRALNKFDNESNDKAVDSLINHETVKYFTNEQFEVNRYEEALRNMVKAQVQTTWSLNLLNGTQAVLIAIGQVASLFLAADRVVENRISIGDFVLINAYLLQIYVPLNFLGTTYRMIKTSLVDVEKMFDLLAEVPDVVDDDDAATFEPKGGDVVFENVDFSYTLESGEQRQIFSNLSLHISAGRRVAIVGPTGSGKTTISRLLYRLYDVQGGHIRIDGQDISKSTLHSLRHSIGIVPQDAPLFHDSVAYNIRYGDTTATDEAVENAARLARVHDFVAKLPDGYATQVGERGLRLSGGEKQRVAIARAMLKRPNVLIFDEATSALDSRTERGIQESMDEVSRGVTTIVIAHRLSTVVNADEIIVLKDGCIAERGTHDDLLKASGEYYKLWTKQLEEEHAHPKDAAENDAEDEE